jgi:hypothetical protein
VGCDVITWSADQAEPRQRIPPPCHVAMMRGSKDDIQPCRSASRQQTHAT